MRATEIFHWEQEARGEFSYTPDQGPDVWLSHADDVLAAHPWEDDCDGLASTVLDLCNRAGLDKSDAYRLRVYASNGSGGHMVGAVKDTANQFWIVGDTFAVAPYPAEQLQHRPIDYNRLSETPWRGGLPWALSN